jgi:hypothetical protein
LSEGGEVAAATGDLAKAERAVAAEEAAEKALGEGAGAAEVTEAAHQAEEEKTLQTSEGPTPEDKLAEAGKTAQASEEPTVVATGAKGTTAYEAKRKARRNRRGAQRRNGTAVVEEAGAGTGAVEAASGPAAADATRTVAEEAISVGTVGTVESGETRGDARKRARRIHRDSEDSKIRKARVGRSHVWETAVTKEAAPSEVRLITAPQKEYLTPSDQLQPLKRNI